LDTVSTVNHLTGAKHPNFSTNHWTDINKLNITARHNRNNKHTKNYWHMENL